MCTTAGVFHEKFEKKNTWEHRVFERMDVFLTNMGMRALCFLENRRIFDKIWAWEHWFFREKADEKGHPIDFYDYKIV